MPPKLLSLPHLQHCHILRRPGGGGALEEEEVVILVVVSWSLE